jgi:hypothetical protein
MNPKMTDSVIDEIHQTRAKISARFSGNTAAIAEDAARRQAASHRATWKPGISDKTTKIYAKTKSVSGY